MSVTVKNPVIKNKFINARKLRLKQALNAIKKDLVDTTTQRGWNRFKSGIQTAEDSPTKGRVFVNDTITGNSKAANSKIGAWLHYGTPSHGPVTAKAMRFKIAGKWIFSKWVMGITASNWWGLKETAKTKVREILSKFYGKI